MLDDIYIFNDIISKENQNILEEYFKSVKNLWISGNNVEYMINSDIYFPQFTIPPQTKYDKNIKDIIDTIQLNVVNNLKLENVHTYRIKINKNPIHKIKPNEDIRSGIHIDRWERHMSIIYYINDTDGDTCFYEYNDNLRNWMKDVESENFHKFKEIRKSSPKKGTVCVFDGMIPHHGSYPTKEERYVINMNITTKDTFTLL
ncbi:MAG: hypothetical protein CMD32_07600 [Flavobacteriales bacterium]|jgi:hypothetical protein|nr:hypothetical protein [Flavobacteriales bacterium]|tara:strand:+ start:2499 stop:3104 length:606 start_codon:yes stop_codon:yes gene_type:complete